MVWCVVKSYEGNTTVFYTVPKSWLHEFEGQTFVFYPPVDAFKDTTKAIISQKPHSSTWKDWPSEVIQHDFGTFLDAKSVEAEVAADKAAWDRYIENGVPTEFGFGRRVIKKPKKLAEITTTEYETDSSDGVTAEKRVMPSPPKKPLITRSSPGIGDGQQSIVSNNKSSPNKVPLASKPSYVSPRETIASSPNKNTTKKVISPLKKNVNTPKKPKDPPRNVSIPSGSQRMVLSSVPVKKPVPPTSPILGKSKPSTSKDPGTYMQAQKVTDPVDATIGKKRKSGTLDIEKWLAAHDSALENSLITDSELVLPFDTNGSGPGPRNPTLEQLTLFNAKKNVVLEKKLDRIWVHLETNSNLEGQLKFSLPCKDYKRVVIVDNLLKTDKTQFDLLYLVLIYRCGRSKRQLPDWSRIRQNAVTQLVTVCQNAETLIARKNQVRVLKSQPSPASRVGSMVNVMLRFLLVDSAAQKFCFTGSEKKYDFKSTTLNEAVIEAVLFMRKTDNVSVEVVGKAVGSWLSQAKKRIQNRSGGSQLSKKSSKKHKKKKHLHIEELHTSQSEADE